MVFWKYMFNDPSSWALDLCVLCNDMLSHDKINHNIFIANLGVPTIFHSRKNWGLVWLPRFLFGICKPAIHRLGHYDWSICEIHGNLCKCRNPIRIVRSIRRESPGLRLVETISSNNIRLNPQDFGKQKRVTHTHNYLDVLLVLSNWIFSPPYK